MKFFTVHLHPLAQENLDAGIAWFDNPARGQAWLDEMMEAIAGLETLPFASAPLNPRRFPPNVRQALEQLDYEVRQKVVGEYYVRFHVDEDQARVLVLQVVSARSADRPELFLPARLPESDPSP
ncbi:MAG: hypothetical protein AAGA48_37710 [Myxococcota bacterium]